MFVFSLNQSFSFQYWSNSKHSNVKVSHLAYDISHWGTDLCLSLFCGLGFFLGLGVEYDKCLQVLYCISIKFEGIFIFQCFATCGKNMELQEIRKGNCPFSLQVYLSSSTLKDTLMYFRWCMNWSNFCCFTILSYLLLSVNTLLLPFFFFFFPERSLDAEMQERYGTPTVTLWNRNMN